MTSHATRDAVERALARADQADAEHMFILRLPALARTAADKADAAAARGEHGPLRGALITVKDNFDVAGYATTAGSQLLADAPPAVSDAPVVERLRRARGVILGRTNMTEFAFSGLGLNPHYGTPANPAFPGEARIPGGSSSGAAVSVGLGVARAAVGTDTGGSIRIPAAFCGLVGFKPTASVVSRRGVLPLSTTLDSVGVIASTVDDCALVFDVIRDKAGRKRRAPRRRIRLGLVENYVTEGVAPEVAAAIAEAVARLERGGISVEAIALPMLDEIPAMMRPAGFSAVESYAWHKPYLTAGRQAEYDPRVLIRILGGADVPVEAYAALVARRQALICEVGSQTAGLDAVLWPTVPILAPTIASLAADEAYHATNGLVLRNSTVANMLDGCAISLPCPTGGAPVGITLAAPSGRDDQLLAVAAIAHALLQEA